MLLNGVLAQPASAERRQTFAADDAISAATQVAVLAGTLGSIGAIPAV